MASEGDHTRKAEILDPLPQQNGGSTEVLALIAHYTDRPDLFLETVEKHDPGFIKRMNENAEANAKEFRRSRFRFGRFQAYTSLAVQVIAALFTFAMLGFASYVDRLDFLTIIAFTGFYAVAQGGRNGFVQIAKGIAGYFSGKRKDAPEE